MVNNRQIHRDLNHAIEHLEDARDNNGSDYHIALALNLLKAALQREIGTRRRDDRLDTK